MAWKLSSAAMPSWMLLISASSAARCSVRAFDAVSSAVRSATFASRPCANCALSSATAACAASIAIRSRSVSWKRPNAPSMSRYRQPSNRCCAISGAIRRERWSSAAAPSGTWRRLAARVRRASSSHGATCAAARPHPRPSAAARRRSCGPPAPSSTSSTRSRAGELGHLIDQEFLKLGDAAQLVQAHAGVGEALERRAQVGIAGQMRGLPLDGKTPATRVARSTRSTISRCASILLR